MDVIAKLAEPEKNQRSQERRENEEPAAEAAFLHLPGKRDKNRLMNLPFLKSGAKRDQILAIDLGGRMTKAVLLRRRLDGFSLVRYAVQEAPIYEKGLSAELLGEHLRALAQALEPKIKHVTVAIGPTESVLRSAEMPLLPPEDLRQMLRYNSKNYLQQDLSGYVFDCWYLPRKENGKADAAKAATAATGKYKVWVGGVRQQLLAELQAGIKSAGLIADQVALTLLGPANAFELACPEVFSKEVVALVDLGFKTSSISILSAGELSLSRVVELGGDRLTAALAESLSISYAEADGIKIGMPQEVEGNLLPVLAPLGRELRASIDFFEHQHDKVVGQIFICGGASRSEFVVQALQSELMAPCKAWNPTQGLHLALPPEQMVDVEQVAPQLTAAIGAAAVSI